MSNIPEIFDQILHTTLRPWLDSNKPDEKFISKLSDIETVEPNFNPLYQIDFNRHFNNKTRYYHKLITNEANNYCNQIIELINADNDERVKKYWIDNTLNKRLSTRISDVGKLIKDNNFTLVFINLKQNTLEIDADHKTETYIMQLLKTALIKVYLEIQGFFNDYNTDRNFEIDDFYTQLLFEPIPENTFLKAIPKPIIVKLIESTPKVEEKINLNIQRGDFRVGYTGKFDYESIDKKDLFERVEMHLFEHEYIDADYNFKNVHGKKRNLAMVYKILIQKGFFKKKNIKHRTKDFEPSEYRQYLDHRYGVNTSQEFSRCTPKVINEFKSKMYFLNSL